jgi:hypothetical protein
VAGATRPLRAAWRAGRARIALAAAPLEASAAAEQVARAFAKALVAASSLEPPDVVTTAEGRLEAALRSARNRYRVLAAAAAAGAPTAYNEARLRVSVAEQAVDQALSQFGLYGYRLAS